MLSGILFGLGISMPVGPVALVSFDYGVRRGFLTAFWFGLGAALADALFAAVAYFCDEALGGWVESYHSFLAGAGALFLLFLGARIMLTSPTATTKQGAPFLTGILLTVANPLVILAFLAFVAFATVTPLWIAGVFVGSLLWWTGTAALSAYLGRRLSVRHILRIRKIGGAFICLLGLWLGAAELLP
jgi:threonine/homoserine/homoserine lactone efflux protein